MAGKNARPTAQAGDVPAELVGAEPVHGAGRRPDGMTTFAEQSCKAALRRGRRRVAERRPKVLARFEDQARRKPSSAAAASVGKKDMAGRVAANPLEGHRPA